LRQYKTVFRLAFLFFLLFSAGQQLFAHVTLKVAAYQNPPLIFVSKSGKIEGFFPDVLREIARREKWKLEWMVADWPESYSRLKNGQIDLLPAVAYSMERSRKIQFNTENLFVNWGVVIVAKGSNINSFIDLKNRTVAILQGDIYEAAFMKLMSDFDLRFKPLKTTSYKEVLALVGTGKADAGIINRLYATMNTKNTGLVQSEIVFAPQNIHIAASPSLDKKIINQIDRNIRQMKSDKASLYYASLNTWLEIEVEAFHLPRWIRVLLIILGLLATTALLFIVLLRRIVKKTTRDLKHSEEQLEAIFKAAGDGILIADVETLHFVRANDAISQMLGYTCEEILDLSIKDIHPADSLKSVNANIKKQVNGEKLVAEDISVLRKDKSIFYADISTRTVTLEGRLCLIGIFRDITRRNKAEKQLRELNSRMRAVYSATSMIIFSLDQNYRYLSFNENHRLTMKHIWGKEIEIGRSMPDYIANDKDRKKAKNNFDKALKGETFVEIEVYGDALLSRKYWENEYAPLTDEKGQVYGLSVFVRDISAQKQAEEAVRIERARLEVTLKSIGDAVIAANIDGTVLMINPVALEWTGWTEKEATGRALHEVFHIINEDSGERVNNPVEKVLTNGKIVGLANHTVLISKNGTRYNIEDSAAPIRDQNGKIIGIVMVFRDVTEKMRTERELIRMEKLESLGVLAGGIAHDFNNILTGVYGNLSLALLQMKSEDPARQYIEIAASSAERAGQLSHRLLTFAKGGEPIKKECNLGEIIREAMELNLAGSNVKGKLQIPEDLPPLFADPGQLSQVFTNLIINARQAMPNGGNLYIDVKVIQDSSIRVRIRDEGEGIPQQNLDKIFDPYFTTKKRGSGLGLAGVFSIITRHEGQIFVESKPGEGTTFIITIPPGGNKQSPESIGNSTQPVSLSSKNILVLEDEPLVCKVMSEMLKNMGHKVQFASEGSDALKLYREEKERKEEFDLVICDLTIPGGMGGKELREVLANEKASAKFIVASGYSDDPVLARYSDYGFDGALSKPFTLKELSHVISALFEK